MTEKNPVKALARQIQAETGVPYMVARHRALELLAKALGVEEDEERFTNHESRIEPEEDHD